ncbi:MAG TPA: thioredoxin domain-containing protein [Caulobacteraceae bacterium]|nr:thioredoxin domain-containing protein [Caulobacteraceae bacterium]
MRAIVTLFTGLALALTLAACQKGGGGAAATADDMSLGSPTAKVQITEYASLGCPHCAAWNNEIFPQFKAKYIDTGKVHYTLREALTGAADISAAGFLTARCAGKDKYFQVVDAVFRAMPNPETADQPKAALLKIAQQVGLTEAQFQSCITDKDALLALNKRWEKYVTDDKINATPTFIINGKTYDKGELSMADLDAAVAEAEAGAGKPK